MGRLVLLVAGLVWSADGTQTEIAVIGTAHAPYSLLSETVTPAHFRAVLELLQPDVVGVETNPVWFANGVLSPNKYEIQEVAVPWAVERNKPVYPIDWQNLQLLARRPLPQRKEETPSVEDLRRTAWARARQLRENYLIRGPNVFEWLNGPDYATRMRQQQGRTGAAAESARYRNQRILHQIKTLARIWPGRRIAILIGAAHKYFLDSNLDREPGLRVVKLPKLSAEEIEAAWTRADRFAVLEATLDGSAYYFHPYPTGIKTERAEEMLRELETSSDDPAAQYFQARLHAARGEYEDAIRLLERVIRARPLEPLPYRAGAWNSDRSLLVRATIELGRCLDLVGRRDEAVAEYRKAEAELHRERPAPEEADAQATLLEKSVRRMTAAEPHRWHEATRVVHSLLAEPWSLLSPPKPGDNLVHNGGFETLLPNRLPQDWQATVAPGKGLKLIFDAATKYEGRRSASLAVDKTYRLTNFNNLIQKVDPVPRGQRVRLRVHARIRNAGEAYALLQVIGNGKMIQSVRSDRLSGTTDDWQELQTSPVDVPEQATDLWLRLGLRGTGQVWYDDVQLEVVAREPGSTRNP